MPENDTQENPPQVVETTPISEKGQSEAFNPYTSCVNTVRLTYPEAPVINASEYPLNGTYENSEILILKYANATGNTFHVAPIRATGTAITLGLEGNFKAGEKTEDRIIENNAKEIVGYFDVNLWTEIQKSSKTVQSILKCESNFNHYKPDGSILRGDAGEYGMAQFKRKTWNWFNSLRDKQDLPKLYDILDPYQQLEMLKWAEQNNLLDHWSCYVRPNG